MVSLRDKVGSKGTGLIPINKEEIVGTKQFRWFVVKIVMISSDFNPLERKVIAVRMHRCLNAPNVSLSPVMASI